MPLSKSFEAAQRVCSSVASMTEPMGPESVVAFAVITVQVTPPLPLRITVARA